MPELNELQEAIIQAARLHVGVSIKAIGYEVEVNKNAIVVVVRNHYQDLSILDGRRPAQKKELNF